MFRQLSIRKQLALVLWGAAVVAFIVMGVGLALYQKMTLERRVRLIVEPYVQFVATATEIAVAFEDSARAQEMLAPLRANPQILSATILLGDGRVLASYHSLTNGEPSVHAHTTDGIEFAGGRAELIRTLNFNACLHLVINLDEINRQTYRMLWLFGAGALVFLAITLGQLLVLQRTLIQPVAALAEAAEVVRTRADYTHRVPAEGHNEVARLGRGFNAMMDAVQERRRALQEVTLFQRALLDNAAYAIVSSTPDGVVTSFNPAAERLLGYAAGEIVGKRSPISWHDPEEVAAQARQLSEELGENITPGFEVFVARARRGQRSEQEWTYIRKDGTRVPVLVSVTGLRDEAGPITGFVGMSSDLTERKKAEAALREKTEELDRYFTRALDLLCIADTDGNFRRLNPVWESTLGWSLNELVGRSFLDLVHPDDREATVQEVSRLAEQKEVLNFTNRYRCKDGSYRWIEWRSYPAGKIIYATARDITERKRTEEMLLRVNKAVECASDAIGMADSQGRHFYQNKAFTDLFEYTPEEINATGREPAGYVDKNVAREVFATIKSGGSWSGEVEVKSKSGRIFPVWMRADAIKDEDGRVIGLVGVHTDITERKRTEKRIRELVAEQRTILNTITIGISRLKNRIHEWTNPAFATMFGYEADEVPGMGSAAFYAMAEDCQRVGAEGYAQIAAGKVFATEALMKRKDGTPFWCSITGQAINPQNLAEGSIWVLQDITERRQAEQALRESQALYSSLVEQLPIGVFRKDKSGRHTFVNSWLCRFRGENPEHFLGKTPKEVEAVELARTGADHKEQPWLAAQGTTHHETIIQTGQQIQCEEEWPGAQGQKQFVHVLKSPVYGPDGTVVGSQGIVFDITERKRAEQALKKFQYSIDQASDAILWINRDARFTYVNEQACRSLGYTREELMRMSLWDIDPVYPKETWGKSWGHVQPNQPGGGLNIETIHRRKDGSTFPVEVVSNHIRFGEEELHVSVVRDITERKQATERLRQLANEQRTILNTTSVAIGFIRNRKFEWVNPVFSGIFGYEPQEVQGQDTLLIYPSPEDHQTVGREAYSLLVQGAIYRTERRLKRKDGSLIWCDVAGQAVNPQNLDEGTIWVLQDITERKQAEAALRENEERLRLALAATNQGLYDLNLQTGQAIVNPEYARMIGYEPGEVDFSAGWWREHLHPDDAEATARTMQECVEGRREEYRLEYRLKTKQGNWRWILSLGRVVECDAAGRPLRMLGTHTDVTERKQAEEALRRGDANLQLALEAARMGDWSWDIVTGEVVWSARCKALYGLAPETVVTYERFLACLHPEDRERVDAALRRAVEERSDYEVEKRAVWPDGSVHWTATRGRVFCDAAGKPVHVAGVTLDITGRKQAEQALREAEETYRTVFQASPDGMTLIDVEGRITFVSPKALEIYRVGRPETAIGRPVLDYIAPEDRARALTDFTEALHGQAITMQEYGLQREDGTCFAGEISTALLRDAGGQPKAVLAISRDITERKRAEEALTASESLLRRSQSVARLGSYYFDAHTGNWIASPGLDEVFGIDDRYPKNVEGWIALTHPDDREMMLHHLRDDVLAGHNRFEKTYRIVRPSDGWTRWVFGLGELEFDAAGEVVRMIGTIQDVTERKEAELALERSLSLLLATLESTADGILVEDASGQIAEYNHRFAELWRFPKEVLESKDEQAALNHVLDQLKAPEAFTAKAHELRAHPESDSFDVLEFKDGRVFERYSHPQLVEGRPLGRVWSFRDVTERKRAEASLQESEQKFRTLFEHMAEGVALHEVIYNTKGRAVDYRLLDVNPAYGRHTGLVPEQTRGHLASQLYGAGSPPYLKEWAEVARTGEPHVFETYFAPMEKHFHISAVSPKPGFFATVFEDITERKRTEEELRRKNEELERFTYTVSHDLKSPLITIKGFTGALQQDIAAGRHQRLTTDLKRIADATDKMADLLNDLLELSRIGRIVNPPADVPVGELVREVLELLDGPIQERGVKITVQPGLPTVHCDRRRISEVYQNLVENAIRYLGSQRRPRIEIGVREQEDGPVFFVRDNGLGIEPRYHETVFGLFNKLDAKTPGTGIGLALARRIIEVHGGKIWVESEGLNQGSVFCFTLPAKTPPGKEKPT